MTQAPVPAGLVDAFWEYERALMSDDVPTLDRLFAPGPTTLRGDANGLLVGHDQISAFRSGRGGAPQRRIVQTHVQTVDDDHALVVAVTELERGGRGQQTQLWVRTADGWRVTAAHVSVPAPAVDTRIWRVVGDPLVAPTGSGPLDGESVAVKDLYAVQGQRIGAGNPAWLADARVEPVHARAVELLLEAGASRARDRPHRRVRLLPRRHQRALRHSPEPPGAAAHLRRLDVRLDQRGVARPRDHRPRHRHRRLDPGARVVPGPLRHPHHPRPRVDVRPAPAVALLRRGRLGDPHARAPAAGRRGSAAPESAQRRQRAGQRAGPHRDRQRRRWAWSSTGTPPSTARCGSRGTSATCRTGCRRSRPCRPGRPGRSAARGSPRDSTSSAPTYAAGSRRRR